MSYDIKEITALIKEAARSAFTQIKEQHPSEHFFAYALTTLDDVCYVSASVNSEQNVQALMQEQNLPKENSETVYYRWSPCEWGKFEYIKPECFGPVDDILQQAYDGLDDENDEFDSYRSDILDAMMAALEELDKEGFWGSGKAREEVTVFTTIYDSFDAEAIEQTSIKRLNPKLSYQKFNQA
ncbi:DUF4303 domain-containing protein [Pleionea sp. CnH1-48]|uniref:DUF4303 domain-containing protein n=1 Tax=Pleionea sp. CnH1-48 TaxID=2954494 RepID=UPI0020978905|nr:DUF4303 domain-containing protein [Pleionea sp. CnH1-48]MCO7226174.1 DUF4303 domain-containing protein [Pleionea sp. CnH1-48]